MKAGLKVQPLVCDNWRRCRQQALMASCKIREEERNGGLQIWSPGPAASASLGNWSEVSSFVMEIQQSGVQPGLLVLKSLRTMAPGFCF